MTRRRRALWSPSRSVSPTASPDPERRRGCAWTRLRAPSSPSRWRERPCSLCELHSELKGSLLPSVKPWAQVPTMATCFHSSNAHADSALVMMPQLPGARDGASCAGSTASFPRLHGGRAEQTLGSQGSLPACVTVPPRALGGPTKSALISAYTLYTIRAETNTLSTFLQNESVQSENRASNTQINLMSIAITS